MSTITLKNVPEGLRERLRHRAVKNRRSLNQEVLFCLEQAVDESGEPSDAAVDQTRAECLAQSKRSLAKIWEDESEDVYNALRPQ